MECMLSEAAEAEVAASILEGDIWMLHVDGTSKTGGFRVGMILAISDGIIIEQALYFSFKTSNNKTEYEALLAGLRLVFEFGV